MQLQWLNNFPLREEVWSWFHLKPQSTSMRCWSTTRVYMVLMESLWHRRPCCTTSAFICDWLSMSKLLNCSKSHYYYYILTTIKFLLLLSRSLLLFNSTCLYLSSQLDVIILCYSPIVRIAGHSQSNIYSSDCCYFFLRTTCCNSDKVMITWCYKNLSIAMK